MREVKTHKVENNPLDFIRIFPEGDPGPGGAPCHYRLSLGLPGSESVKDIPLRFQTGKEPSGVTNEALLAVVIDRLQEFQKNKVISCRENALALTKLEEALHWMQHRTRDRIAREVIGEVKP